MTLTDSHCIANTKEVRLAFLSLYILYVIYIMYLGLQDCDIPQLTLL